LAIADDWLPAAWGVALTAAEGSADAGASVAAAVPDPGLAGVAEVLARGWEALDRLEVDGGRALMLDARAAAGRLAGPGRAHALWLVAARQARSGFTADSRETRASVPGESAPASLPVWLVIELMRAEMAAPVLEWCAAHSRDAAPVLAEMVAVVRARLAHREAGELSDHGPRADPTTLHPPADAGFLAIHEAVENNQFQTAAALADRQPRPAARAAAWLTIARTLAWNAGGGDG
jgi:hypothetical protein